MNVLYFDTETNGIGAFHPSTQRLVQLAWSMNGEAQSFLINDVRAINPQVPHPHTVQSCSKEGVSFDRAFGAFMAALRACEMLVAHNIAFDRSTLAHELHMRGASRTTVDEFARHVRAKAYCTMQNTTSLCQLPSRSKRHTGYKYPTLAELHKHLFETVPTGLHDASVDVDVLRRCFEALADRGLGGLAVEG